MFLPRSSSTAYLRLCILSALGVFSLNATAATDSTVVSNNEVPEVELDEIVVTATRTPTKTSNVIAQTRVVDSEELKHYQGQSAFEVLKQQPGISHYTNGGMGTVSNFYMRGYDSKQILVLIDGIRYSSVSNGGAALNLLPADQIDRIEILYGASGSSIYGADAMGGVIQIFTKGSNVDQSSMSVTAGVGSNDQYLYGASAQFANDTGTTLSLSASHNESDGISAKLPSASGYNKDEDGFESDNVSIALNQRINDQWLAGVSALYSKSTTDFDDGSYENAHADQENGSAQAYVDWNYMPGSSLKLQYGHSIDKSDSSSQYGGVFDTKQDQISLLGQHQLSIGQGFYGIEYLNQSLDSSAYEIDDRDVTSAFFGYVFDINQFDAQANLRYDDNSQYGDETTYNLGGAYHINPDWRIGTSYAKGFRAPTFNDIYPGYGGNPDLKPETSDNYEAFVEYSTPLQSTRLTGYYNDVEDLISYVATPTTANPYAGATQNVDRAEIKGLTLTSDWTVDNYLFGGSYDYQQAEDNSGGNNDGNYLPYRPEHKGLVYVGYRLPSLDIRAEYQYVGDYYSRITNTDAQFIDNYGLLNISGSYELTDNLSMTARLNNITNESYITDIGYKTDGTNFFTSLTYNWH
ncbi:TonB-dependent receptor [Psychrobacter sp. SCQQ22]|uniref:TonB-dependent receptor plug domain-containing protein n=1 Tax=Psychrobacter sp. SCQQ22 TaxID=2792059 RepID=UPI0018CCE688|nr:TonB-dependent receptor [Psychrobacter sp. SCQQ22]MBH0086180.1 TonB-dependent receptor [Psychrobacter sp. SCQQ22]